MTEPFIRELETFEEADMTRDDAYDKFSERMIRYLKNVGLLDCRYSYEKHTELIFLTDAGREYLDSYRQELKLQDLSDIIASGRPLSGEEFEAALRKASSASLQRGPFSVFVDPPYA